MGIRGYFFYWWTEFSWNPSLKQIIFHLFCMYMMGCSLIKWVNKFSVWRAASIRSGWQLYISEFEGICVYLHQQIYLRQHFGIVFCNSFFDTEEKNITVSWKFPFRFVCFCWVRLCWQFVFSSSYIVVTSYFLGWLLKYRTRA